MTIKYRLVHVFYQDRCWWPIHPYMYVSHRSDRLKIITIIICPLLLRSCTSKQLNVSVGRSSPQVNTTQSKLTPEQTAWLKPIHGYTRVSTDIRCPWASSVSKIHQMLCYAMPCCRSHGMPGRPSSSFLLLFIFRFFIIAWARLIFSFIIHAAKTQKGKRKRNANS